MFSIFSMLGKSSILNWSWFFNSFCYFFSMLNVFSIVFSTAKLQSITLYIELDRGYTSKVPQFPVSVTSFFGAPMRYHLMQEPSALVAHAGICAGGVPGNRHSYRDPDLTWQVVESIDFWDHHQHVVCFSLFALILLFLFVCLTFLTPMNYRFINQPHFSSII